VEDLANLRTFKGLLLRNPSEYGIACFGTFVAKDSVLEYGDDFKKLRSRKFYEYRMETGMGDCGAPVFVVEKGIQRKLIGIHVAGGNGIGYATPILAEEIIVALATFNPSAQMQPMINTNLVVETSDIEMPEGTFYPLGTVADAPGIATKTQLRPSLVCGEIVPITTKPAHLSFCTVDGKTVHPLDIGLKKAGVVCTPMDPDLIEACGKDFLRVMRRNRKYPFILDDRQMVAGIDGEQFMPSIKRSTSAGWPFSLFYSHGKKELISDTFEIKSILKEMVDKRIESAKKGERTATVWVDTLKDERRPFAKVDAGKTRVFAAGPVDYTLAFRKYFLGFAASMCDGRIDNEISVGTNPYSLDWERTKVKILQHGNHVIAGDFSNYDGTLQIHLLELICDLINDWYDDGEENALVRKTLWREIVNSIHLKPNPGKTGGILYQWTHSQPSGCPITAILNSVYNSLSVRYVWLLLAKKYQPEKANMIAFHQHVSLVSYGDDNVLGVAAMEVPWFNQINISEAYTTFGMTYTDEAKSGKLVNFRKIEDVSYLKRAFVYMPEIGRTAAPLDLTTVLEMTNWIRGDLSQEDSTLENMSNSLFELALHGRECYDDLSSQYAQAAEDAGIDLVVPTWSEMIYSRLMCAVRADRDFDF
jgi:hypothetical protein